MVTPDEITSACVQSLKAGQLGAVLIECGAKPGTVKV